MELPLVDRELARHSRNRTTYALRTVVGGVACVYVLFMFLVSSAGDFVTPESVGKFLYGIGLTIQFGGAMLLPAFVTARTVAQEKQERTLGLLLLADFRGADVVLAKFTGAFIYCAYLVLGALPVLAVASLLGGLSVRALTGQTLLFLLTAGAACAVGVLCSTISKRTGAALFLATALTLGSFYGAISLELGPIEIITGIDMMIHPATSAFDAANFSRTTSDWFPATLLGLGVWIGSSLLAIYLLPRQAQERPAAHKLFRKTRKRLTPRVLQLSPVGQVFARGSGGLSSASESLPLRILASLGLIFVAVLPCIGPLFIVGLIMYDVVTSMEQSRKGGIFDDLRLTAPWPRRFLKEIYIAQVARAAFYVPALAVAGLSPGGAFMLFGAGMLTPMMISQSGEGRDWYVVLAWVVFSVVSAIVQVAFIVAIACLESSARNTIGPKVVAGMGHYIGWIILLGIASGVAAAISFARFTGSFGQGYEELLAALLFLSAQIAFFGVLALAYYSSYRTAYERFV